jgi:hypothetical protein
VQLVLNGHLKPSRLIVGRNQKRKWKLPAAAAAKRQDRRNDTGASFERQVRGYRPGTLVADLSLDADKHRRRWARSTNDQRDDANNHDDGGKVIGVTVRRYDQFQRAAAVGGARRYWQGDQRNALCAM